MVAVEYFLGVFLKGAPMPIYTDGTFQKGASLSVVGFEVLLKIDVFKKEYI